MSAAACAIVRMIVCAGTRLNVCDHMGRVNVPVMIYVFVRVLAYPCVVHVCICKCMRGSDSVCVCMCVSACACQDHVAQRPYVLALAYFSGVQYVALRRCCISTGCGSQTNMKDKAESSIAPPRDSAKAVPTHYAQFARYAAANHASTRGRIAAGFDP